MTRGLEAKIDCVLALVWFFEKEKQLVIGLWKSGRDPPGGVGKKNCMLRASLLTLEGTPS